MKKRETFERKLPHRPEKVWRALTEEGELSGWFPATIEGERGKGAQLRFVFRNGEGPEVGGTITEWDPPRVLAYTMGDESLRWELSPTPEGCVLVLHTELARDGVSTERKPANDNGPAQACAQRLAA
ncbi:SRPBCC family protein [Pendulispora albinea]|uniref:SRPBCC family protein n=1 Tax=Pendulispora albinea TaxID=2741071 RepID=A0ABZ2M5I5_9BACT